MESAAPQEITWEKPTTPTISMARATGTRSTSSSSSPIRPMPPIISLLMMDTSPIGGEESAQQGVQQAAQRQQSAEQGPELIDGGHGQAQVLGDLAAHGGHAGLLPEADGHHRAQHHEAGQEESAQALLPHRGEAVAEGLHHHLGTLDAGGHGRQQDRKSTRLNSSHVRISYAVFCLKKKKHNTSENHLPT